MHIPRRFEEEVALHVIQNLRPSPADGTALILGIHGPSGEGKTYQLEAVLRKASIKTLLISGGELESGTAGYPSQLVRTAYKHAGAYISNKEPAAVLLNDADAAIGSWGDMTQYTVNTQNVVTELMHLADYPTRVEGQPTPRVPLFITGNDFSRLYGPLCREGRMHLFRWELSSYERLDIVEQILTDLSPVEVESLLTEFPNRRVAFWASVSAYIKRQRMLDILSHESLAVLAAHFVKGGDIPVESRIKCDAAMVRTAAKQASVDEQKSHLE